MRNKNVPFFVSVIVGAVIALASLWLTSCQTLKSAESAPTSVTVTESTIQLLGPLTDETLSEPLKQLSQTPEGGTAYIYILSYGGDPVEVGKFLDLMEGKTTVCFGEIVGGPAFTIFQNCTYRLAAADAVVGNAEYTIKGASGTPAELATLAEQFKKEQDRAVEIEAGRLGIDEKDYRNLLASDDGNGFAWKADELSSRGGADVSSAGLACDKQAVVAPMERTFKYAFFAVKMKFTKCPIDRQYMGNNYPSQVFQWFGVPFVFPNKD